MKRIKTTILLLLSIAAATFAQQNVAVKYDVSNRDSDRSVLVKSEMVLITNPQQSLYYNTMSQYVDSCESTPEGAAKLREIQMKAWRVVQPDGTVTYDGRKLGLAPEKKEFLYVQKNFVDGEQTVYDYKGGGLFRYDEPLSEMTWEIKEDSVNNILGYECIMAESDYHGRRWKAWFTPDIPLADGPWKLHGLPGIILKADGGDDFLIQATEIGATSLDVPPVYSVKDYQKGERKKILSDHEHYINNLESIMSAQGIKMNADGSPANLPKYNRQQKAWETDY